MGQGIHEARARMLNIQKKSEQNKKRQLKVSPKKTKKSTLKKNVIKLYIYNYICNYLEYWEWPLNNRPSSSSLETQCSELRGPVK